jgi:hypothetical protein
MSNKKVILLVTDVMLREMDIDFEITQSWGYVTAVFGESPNLIYKTGKHCEISLTENDLDVWIKKSPEFITGSGSPIMQSFTLHQKT